MCGEAGEAANVAKKLRRVELELDGNAKSDRPLKKEELISELAGECADVFLYLSLLASRYDIDLESAVIWKFNSKSVKMGFPERLVRG
jgi:NTP pyrophosphatase (non-canonical NTP hydrolase)